MGCCDSFIKYVLFFFNLLFTVLGLIILGFGVCRLVVPNDELNSELTTSPWLIGVGIIMLVIAFFGTWGSIRENHFMVATYAILLLVIITAQVAIAVHIYLNGDTFLEGLLYVTKNIFEGANDSDILKFLKATVEEQFACCGWTSLRSESCCGPSGWNLPPVACKVFVERYGCDGIIKKFYEEWENYIINAAVGIVAVEVVCTLFALCQASHLKNKNTENYDDYSYIDDSNFD